MTSPITELAPNIGCLTCVKNIVLLDNTNKDYTHTMCIKINQEQSQMKPKFIMKQSTMIQLLQLPTENAW